MTTKFFAKLDTSQDQLTTVLSTVIKLQSEVNNLKSQQAWRVVMSYEILEEAL